MRAEEMAAEIANCAGELSAVSSSTSESLHRVAFGASSEPGRIGGHAFSNRVLIPDSPSVVLVKGGAVRARAFIASGA